MSSSGPGGSGGEKKGFQKFMRRASKVLRGGPKRESTSGTAGAGPSTSATAPSQPTASTATPSAPVPAAAVATAPTPASDPKASTPLAPVEEPKAGAPIFAKGTAKHATTAAEYNQIQEDRARALFQKYGLTLEPGEWTPPLKNDTERVEKKIRMRVHRQCHRCQTTFGPDKLCSNCSHTRCKKCPRFPTKRATKDGKGKKAAAGALAAPPGKDDRKSRAKVPLKMLDRKSGHEVHRKHPKQRVRRHCHKCHALFPSKATVCDSCKHVRCPQCPREPPKLKKYPKGYPGDAIEIVFECEKCNTVFPEHGRTCEKCGHARCADCRQTALVPRGEEGEGLGGLVEGMRGVGLSPAA